MRNPKVSIIIVNWNGGKVFEDCLRSVKGLKYPNFELIIFDNGSTDGTQKYATLRSKENLGFVGGNNKGVKIATGKYILLLNNDTKVPAYLLNVLINKMENDKNIGILQPKIYLMDKPGYLDNAGSFLNTLGFGNHWGFMEKDRKEFDKEREIFSAKGACLMTRKEIVDKIGLFDEDYFAYFEESDFCWRVWMSGWRVLYYPKTFIYHKLGFTSNKLSMLNLSFHSLKNRIQSFIKNFEFSNLFFYLSIHLLVLTCLMLVYLLELRLEKALMVIKAFQWNIKNLRKTLEKRKLVQKLRVKKDKEVLPIIMQSANFFSFLSHFFETEKNFKR